MKRAIALLATACGGSPLPAPPVQPACDGVGVAFTPPSAADRAAGDIAHLHGTFAGDGMGPRAHWVCLSDGHTRRRMHEQFAVDIHASARELQRISIDGVPILLHVPPGGDIQVAYHPCANWELWDDELDSGEVDDGIVARRGEPCPDGYVDGGDIHEASDPHCRDVAGRCPYVRCIRGARLALAADAGRAIRLVDDDGTPRETLVPGGSLAVAPYGGFCPELDTIATGSERVRIAPGLGARWQLTVDASGRVRGSVAAD